MRQVSSDVIIHASLLRSGEVDDYAPLAFFGITARLLVMTLLQSVGGKGPAMKPADSCCEM